VLQAGGLYPAPTVTAADRQFRPVRTGVPARDCSIVNTFAPDVDASSTGEIDDRVGA
jgi:hypothetical protein